MYKISSKYIKEIIFISFWGGHFCGGVGGRGLELRSISNLV